MLDMKQMQRSFKEFTNHCICWVLLITFSLILVQLLLSQPVHGQAIAPLTNAIEDPSTPRNNAVVSIATIESAPLCTGVLIVPTLVLTAGHCLQGAIVDGGSGRWDSRNPIWRTYNLPEPSPNTGWISQIKGEGRYTNRIIAPFNYRDIETETSNACQALCNGEGQCRGWTYNVSSRRCFLKREPKFRVFFGNRHDSPIATVESSSYSVAGYADIAIMRLDRPVSTDIAIPAPVMSHLFNNERDIRTFLRRQQFVAVGFTISNPTRRNVQMSFGEYPLRNDLVMLRTEGFEGSTIEPGDSGSPLFILRREPDGLKRYVVGISQGVEGGGGRYTLTGVNLARRGALLSFPYDPSSIDRQVAAPIGEWLNNVLYADFTQRFAVVPLYNWYSSARGDNFLSSDPRWASDPLGIVPNSTGLYLDPPRIQNEDYRMFRLEGYAFNPKRPQPLGTVPLWSWYNPAREDNFATTHGLWSSDPRSVSWNGEHISGGRNRDGYTQYRLEGFIYDTRLPQPPNTRPLFSWWNSSRADNFATTDPNWSIDPSTVRWSGEHITNGQTQQGYGIFRLEGYLPTSPR